MNPLPLMIGAVVIILIFAIPSILQIGNELPVRPESFKPEQPEAMPKGEAPIPPGRRF